LSTTTVAFFAGMAESEREYILEKSLDLPAPPADVAATPLQPLLPHERRDARAVVPEEPVQGPQRDVVSSGDGGRREFDVAQMLADEALHLQELHVLAGFGGCLVRGIDVVGQPCGDQVDEDAAQPVTVGRIVGAAVGGQVGEETRE
jgi:hypothetical protein